MRWSGGRVGLRRRIKAPFSQGARVQIPSGLFWKRNALSSNPVRAILREEMLSLQIPSDELEVKGSIELDRNR